MRHPKHRKQRNIAQQMKGILTILLVVLAFYVVGSVILLDKIRGQAIQEMNEMSKLYTNEIDNRFFRISRNLFSTMAEKDQPDSVFWNYIDAMKEDRTNSDYSVKKLREYSLSNAWEYGTEYQFFIYLDEEQQYYKLSMTDEDGYEEEAKLKKAILNQITQIKNTSYSVKKKWNTMSVDNENYICKIAQNKDVYLGCYVNIKSILEPFSNIIMGKNGYVRLVDGQNQIVDELTSEGIVANGNEKNVSDRYSIIKKLKQAPFQIQIRISSERILDVMMGSMMVLLGLTVTFIIAGVAILVYLRKNLLKPVQQFTRNLEKYDKGDYAFHLTEVNLLELEQIDDKFKYMIHQIKRLKITLYEQELQKNTIELDYLKLQIRPHFYLNCLNFIYSMIDFKQYDNASKMILATSDYLQYIFRNANEAVAVCAETNHCRDYLDILLLRYPESFEYYIEVHEEVKEASILPFLIQVFVENAAKHALTLEEKILISVTVYPEDRTDGKYVNIYISDTGKGYPEKILQTLKSGKGISKEGRHLGIENCLRRFHYYYKEQGNINFDNSPLGGAIVDIHIPYYRYQNNGGCE
ncbi:two-component system sensor histidine kinase YesM [Lachnotalea glycerini]|uniref:Two-component system sensor histidine kinase YesM n=1 Tax=Lachnotalea glycerini TaxID=1763509 RepID=A0A318ERF1_9FIRM|nr:sensor histidine kinase [Lachnotalea glycerini]PXV85381.1 two-component system sensor histidine kinase YesM [Lachnotalea glycerini]